MIKIDIDQREVDWDRIGFVRDFLHLEGKVWIQRTPRGWHVLMNDNIPNDKDKLIIQLLMGSDWTRELYNYRRVNMGVPEWNILHDKKNGWVLVHDTSRTSEG